ncbi:FISUMP domain-containing protein [Bacteroidota bacterium]
MKNIQLYLLVHAIFVTTSGLCQKSDTIFYDEDWIGVKTEDKAAFFRVVKYDDVGNPIGMIRDFYITGELQGFIQEAIFIDNNDDANSIYKGRVSGYYKSGRTEFEMFYDENGELDGPFTETGEDGQLIRKEFYQQGKLNGISYYYDEDIRWETPFSDGIVHGKVKYYDRSNDKLQFEQEFVNDMPINPWIIMYDDSGIPTKIDTITFEPYVEKYTKEKIQKVLFGTWRIGEVGTYSDNEEIVWHEVTDNNTLTFSNDGSYMIDYEFDSPKPSMWSFDEEKQELLLYDMTIGPQYKIHKLEEAKTIEIYGGDDTKIFYRLNKDTNNKNNASSKVIIDSRDDKKYKTVKIGNQIWMNENMKYDGLNPYISPDNQYYYTMQNAEKVCPIGYHLPSKKEFELLIDNLDISNETFSLQGDGYYTEGSSWGVTAKDHIYLWSSTKNSKYNSYVLSYQKSFGTLRVVEFVFSSPMISVRCIKD